MFHASRKPLPLPKPAERIVNALTDSIQPLIDVPRNVVAFARKQIRQYHGVQEIVIAFYQALAEGRRPPATAEDAISVVRWTEEVARAADLDHEKRTARFKLSASVPYLVTGASGTRIRGRRTPSRQGATCPSHGSPSTRPAETGD